MSKLVKFAFLLAFWQSVCLACSCRSSNCTAFGSADLEFLGTATRVYTTILPWFAQDVAIDFSVSETFGKLGKAKTITVRTPAQPTACGYPFQVGVEYFVSANAGEDGLSTNTCSRTQPAITAAALLRQLRAIKAGKPAAQLFGFVGTESYPGLSLQSRVSAKPIGSVSITAVGAAGEFTTATMPDGSFEFARLPASVYRLRVNLPANLFIWYANSVLGRQFDVRPGAACQSDIPLYRRGDPFGR